MNVFSKDKRAYARIHTSMDIRLYCGNMFYSGTVMNLSEKGMFISTKRCVPHDSSFGIIIRTENKLIQVLARAKRLTQMKGYCAGMGAEIISSGETYLEFIERLRFV